MAFQALTRPSGAFRTLGPDVVVVVVVVVVIIIIVVVENKYLFKGLFFEFFLSDTERFVAKGREGRAHE